MLERLCSTLNPPRDLSLYTYMACMMWCLRWIGGALHFPNATHTRRLKEDQAYVEPEVLLPENLQKVVSFFRNVSDRDLENVLEPLYDMMSKSYKLAAVRMWCGGVYCVVCCVHAIPV